MAMRLYERVTHAVRWWLLRKLPTCRQTVKVMSESMERPLTLRERIELKLHLWVCIWCVWYLEHIKLLRAALRERAAHEDMTADAHLPPEARERIKRALKSSP